MRSRSKIDSEEPAQPAVWVASAAEALERAEHTKDDCHASPHDTEDSLAWRRLRQDWDSRETWRRDTPGPRRGLMTQLALGAHTRSRSSGQKGLLP